MITKSGLDFYVCSSAFQKFIRRGMEHEALWYGTELYLSSYDEYAWFRLKVIVSEDIGLANPHIASQINALYVTYTELKKKKNKHQPEKLQFIHAVILCVRSQKSRLIDNKVSYYFDLRDKCPKPELPDYIFDMHTIKGKILKRGNDHFYEEAAHINNWDERIDDEYSFRDMVWEMYAQRDIEKIQFDNDIKEKENDQTELF